ncbi:MAG: glycosyl transferase, family 2 [Bryobacterales bacterium]|nr:glycosyl transferase, family 2 [Bryobacterales bacterium]
MITSKLSVLIPLFNEEDYVGTILRRVIEAPLPRGMKREVIVVDDGSSDDSCRLVQQFAELYPDTVRLIRHERNQGKGAAIRTAITHATGEFSIIQDADLEYNPREYSRLLRPLLTGEADAVFGSRFAAAGERRVLYFWHSVANRALTTLCNIFSDLNLTDMETCYKAFRTELVKSIPIRSNRFGIEPELTIKLAQRKARIFETPITYHGRTYDEGKKIGLKDAFDSLFVMVKTAWSRDIYKDNGPETLEALSVAPRFNRWMADTVEPYLGKEIMEIGAGIGNLTKLFIRRRKRYVAADIDRRHLARLGTQFGDRPNFESRYCDLNYPEHFAEFADQLDTVICLNVLEHVEDDTAGLKSIYSVLKPGGRAVILVPCGKELFGTLDTALGHYRRYSRQELMEKIAHAGFVVDQALDFNRISRPAWYVSGRMLKRTVLKRGQLRLFDQFVWLWRGVDPLLPWGPVSLIVICSKPAAAEAASRVAHSEHTTPAMLPAAASAER